MQDVKERVPALVLQHVYPLLHKGIIYGYENLDTGVWQFEGRATVEKGNKQQPVVFLIQGASTPYEAYDLFDSCVAKVAAELDNQVELATAAEVQAITQTKRVAKGKRKHGNNGRGRGNIMRIK